MRKKSSLLLFLFTLFTMTVLFAQEQLPLADKPEMAVGMRANGKIYVVVAVVVTILVGVILYLINIDKKISKLEKQTAR